MHYHVGIGQPPTPTDIVVTDTFVEALEELEEATRAEVDFVIDPPDSRAIHTERLLTLTGVLADIRATIAGLGTDASDPGTSFFHGTSYGDPPIRTAYYVECCADVACPGRLQVEE